MTISSSTSTSASMSVYGVPGITASGTTSILSSNDNIMVKTKIENATEGLSHSCFNYLFNKVMPGSRGKENAITICDYISSIRSEINQSDNYRRDTITLLCNLSIFFKNVKLFKEITRDDFLSFLDGYRKTESVDPLHKWIGTYNTYRIHLMRFFKWLYYPDIEPDKRPKPEVIHNIHQLKRKEKSTYKATDLWTPDDDSLCRPYHNIWNIQISSPVILQLYKGKLLNLSAFESSSNSSASSCLTH